jgi:hypothetical protein
MKLYYFDNYGFAEPIRMALNWARVPFEDIRLAEDEFRRLRDERDIFEFG